MKREDLDHATPETLTQVMRVGQSWGDEAWSHRDLAEMLEHLLACDLTTELDGPNNVTEQTLRQLAGSCTPPLETLGDVLTTPNPPVELLKIIKEYSKVVSGLPDRTLPKPIATVLYLGSIVAAWVHGGVKITQHSRQDVAGGVSWSLSQPWLEMNLRDLFEQFLQDTATGG